MASTAFIARVGRSAFLAGHIHHSEDALPATAARPAFLHQRTARRSFVIRGQQSPSRRSGGISRQGSGQPGLSNIGRRSAFRLAGERVGRGTGIGAAASGNADPGELRVVEISSHQKTAANPYGYAWWKVALAVAATAAFFYLFTSLEAQMHALQAPDLPKITIPDKWPWPQLRTPAELEATFNILGEAGRGIYKRYMALDFVFPLVYTVLYSQLLGFLVVWSQFWARIPRNMFPSWIGSLAYTVFPWDLLENAAVFYVMSNPGTALSHKVAAAAGYFTWVKILMVVVNVSFMYMGLLLGVFDFVFKLLRNRYDGLSAIIYSLAQR